VEDGFARSDVVIEREYRTPTYEHAFLEPEASVATVDDDGRITVYVGSQIPFADRRQIAETLGLPEERVRVAATTLGGAFGGKEDQATPFAAMASLASVIVGAPVKLILSRPDDMRITGKRHPYSADFKIGATKSGKILAYEVTYYQNSGAAADLSTAVLERSLFHTTNSYNIPNVKATGLTCRTNLPPNTAFRGFGGPQGMFVIEAAIAKLADAINKPAFEIQRMTIFPLITKDLFKFLPPMFTASI